MRLPAPKNIENSINELKMMMLMPGPDFAEPLEEPCGAWVAAVAIVCHLNFLGE